ncbi:hypothetical protein BOX15_Mlig029595g1, partial [Macrostomum lignano]
PAPSDAMASADCSTDVPMNGDNGQAQAAASSAGLSAATADPAAGVASDEYIVEKILQMRIHQGKKQYLIKWKGYGPEENSWVPEENCDCPDIVEAFERERKQSRDAAARKKSSGAAEKKRAALQQVIEYKEPAGAGPRGFDRGLQPDRILGATDSLGELMFLMKWRESDEADLVPARQANVRCPQIVIAFYEERLAWCRDEEAVGGAAA